MVRVEEIDAMLAGEIFLYAFEVISSASLVYLTHHVNILHLRLVGVSLVEEVSRVKL